MARPRSDIAPRIREAARRCFLADGVDGASLRTIAREARTSIGMVSYYFPTKDDLFAAVVEEVYGALVADLGRCLDPALPVRERLRRAVVRLGEASAVELDVMRLVLREALVSSARLERLLGRFQRGHLALLAATMADGVAAGELDAELPPPVLLVATMAMVGLPAILRRVLGDRAPVGRLPRGEELAPLLVDVLYRGIGARPPARRRRRAARD